MKSMLNLFVTYAPAELSIRTFFDVASLKTWIVVSWTADGVRPTIRIDLEPGTDTGNWDQRLAEAINRNITEYEASHV